MKQEAVMAIIGKIQCSFGVWGVLLLITVFLLLPGTGRAQNWNMECIGSCTLVVDPPPPQFPTSVFVSGRYAYVTGYGVALEIVDVINPTDPRLLSQFYLGGGHDEHGVIWDVFVQGPYAYLSYWFSGGLSVVDVTDPLAPFLASRIPQFVGVQSIVSGNYIYWINEDSGFRWWLTIYDIADPVTPQFVSETFLGYEPFHEFYLDGDRAYLLYGPADVLIFDITNPVSPELITRFHPRNYAHAIFVLGDYAYVGTSSRQLDVLDVHDPFNPVVVDSCNVDGIPRDITGCYPHLYVVETLPGFLSRIYAFSIYDAAHPVLEGYYTDSAYVTNFYAAKDLLYAITDSAYSNPAQWNLKIVGFTQTSVDDIPGQIPEGATSLPAYPNPFNAQTTISYTLPAASHVTFEAFDLTGRRVAVMPLGVQAAGKHAYTWEAGELSSGIYFYRIKAGEYSETRKCVLLK